MMKRLLVAAAAVALVGPAVARDAKPRVQGIYACVNAANAGLSVLRASRCCAVKTAPRTFMNIPT